VAIVNPSGIFFGPGAAAGSLSAAGRIAILAQAGLEYDASPWRLRNDGHAALGALLEQVVLTTSLAPGHRRAAPRQRAERRRWQERWD
jgi:hypothetical protein